MAIRTELSESDLTAVAEAWGLGKLQSFRGLPEGSINTLYVLETGTGKQVLRLSEGRREEEVSFETALLGHLERERFPAVRLLRRVDGAPYGVVRERFACVFTWAAGYHLAPKAVTREQALELGRVLGRLHAVGESFPRALPNRYAPAQIGEWIRELVGSTPADPELAAALPRLEEEAALLESLPTATEGVIHADLFPDNVKWVGDRVSSVLDFEMACRAPYVLDLAICLHAFCWNDDDFATGRLQAIVEGYQSERRLSGAEKSAFFAWSRFAALRFTVTRIRDFHLSTLEGDKLLKKDWRRYRDRLERVVALGPEGWRSACGL